MISTPLYRLLRRTAPYLLSLLLISQNAYCREATHYLFSHGLTACAGQVVRYTSDDKARKWYYGPGPIIIAPPYTAFDYDDAKAHFWKANLAQEGDLAKLEAAYQAVIDEAENSPNIVLIGVSRGASILPIFLGTSSRPNVRAAILESPFDSINALLTRQVDRVLPGPCGGLSIALNKRVIPRFLRYYNPSGPTPLDTIPTITPELPILVVCSRKDGIVPVESSIEIYNKLRETGHKNAHILILTKGPHSRIKRNSPEGEIYRNVVHAFYKRYNLPHNPEWAQLGQATFNQTQPVIL